MKRKTLYRLAIITTVLFSTLLFGFNYLKKEKGQDAVNILSGILKQRVGMDVALEPENDPFATAESQRGTITLDSTITPFEEIGQSLGDAASGNNVLTNRGASAFDANGDGLQDLFFVHSGRPLARPSDENGVLQMDDRVDAKPCVLYLNQGTDDNGNPIFSTIQDLQKAQPNSTYVKEELLIENKYTPRTSVEDDPYAEGRIGTGTVTADFDGDGRIDILILNHHYGTPFVKPGLGMRVYPGANHLGRDAKEASDYIETNIPEFLVGDLEDGMHKTYRNEPEGMNSLYLNKGDKDNDGLPEWEFASEAAGLTTNYSSSSATVADIDRDGDLDVYITNFIDPDFWAFGATNFGGHRNTLWINQLSETGEFSFVEKAQEWGVAGLPEVEPIEDKIPLPNGGFQEDAGVQTVEGEQVGENAEHSWAGQFTDLNQDGYPDLVVANDIPNRMRVYLNEGGKSFRYLEQFDDPKYIGCWMGIASGDLDSDGSPELLLTNCGAQTYSIRNTALFVTDPNEMNTVSLAANNALKGQASLTHMLFTFGEEGLKDITTESQVSHSPYIAPDIVHTANIHPLAKERYGNSAFANSIGGLEFAWNPSFFDIDNDSDLDIYMVGALSRGNDNFIGDWTTGPGRLLVNSSTPGNYRFADKTLEYQAMDIVGMDYSVNPPRRKSPGTGWHKEDYIYLQDRDAYAGMGLEASQKSNVKDIFRMHEQANGHFATDLNQDGLNDMVVLHSAGYNSTSPAARNLKLQFMGKALAVPPPNKVVKAPTTFEEGATFVYINKAAPQGQAGNWVKLRLQDASSSNVFAIGARVVVNGHIVRGNTVGGESFCAVHEDIHVGLGDEALQTVEVYWPSGSAEPEVYTFEAGTKNEVVTIRRKSERLSAR